jgi:hydrogenase-4 component F
VAPGVQEAHFAAWLLGFQAAMSLVTVSQHFGLMWVAVEATTLLSAPLIHYHRHRRSLEATWKYLLICSVGIAVALLGTYFLSAAASSGSAAVPLFFRRLAAARLNAQWLKAAFILLLVGYGTKMGLAPLHTWLPDAHSEAPSPVSALLSGALLNCAFLAILRIHGVCAAAGLGDFSRQLLLILGLASMAVAAAFILGQTDYKRLLPTPAWSTWASSPSAWAWAGWDCSARSFTPSITPSSKPCCSSRRATSWLISARRTR